MRIIHLLRKPLEAASVALNSLDHGCGGLNVDASRIATTDNTMGPGGRTALGLINDDGWKPKQVMCGSRKGRWPANLVLEHRPGCDLVGVKRVVTGTAVQGGRDPTEHTSDMGWGFRKQTEDEGYAGEDGREEVEDWACVPGCAIHDLDSQSEAMGMHSAGSNKPPGGFETEEREGWFLGGIGNEDFSGARLGDKGGGSRFFKQIGGRR